MNRLQRWLAPWHRWIGLIAGAYLLVISASGTALLFRTDLQRALDPRLFTLTAEGPRADPVVVLQSLARAYPDSEVGSLDMPTDRTPTMLAQVYDGLRFRRVLVDPVSGSVLGELPRRELIRVLNALHYDLTLGSIGRWINAIGGGVLATLGLTGIILWWRGRRRWRSGLTVKRGQSTAALHRDLHSAGGIWTSVLLLMWGLTGVTFIFPEPFMHAIGQFSAVDAPEPPQVQPRGDEAPAPLSTQIAAAQRALPDLHVARIVLPGHASVPLLVEFAHHSPTRAGEPLQSVYVDPVRAQVIGSPLTRTAGEVVWGSFTTLHTGSFGGLGVRLLWLLFGLAPALLLVTGLTTWCLRRWQQFRTRAAPWV